MSRDRQSLNLRWKLSNMDIWYCPLFQAVLHLGNSKGKMEGSSFAFFTLAIAEKVFFYTIELMRI